MLNKILLSSIVALSFSHASDSSDMNTVSTSSSTAIHNDTPVEMEDETINLLNTSDGLSPVVARRKTKFPTSRYVNVNDIHVDDITSVREDIADLKRITMHFIEDFSNKINELREILIAHTSEKSNPQKSSD